MQLHEQIDEWLNSSTPKDYNEGIHLLSQVTNKKRLLKRLSKNPSLFHWGLLTFELEENLSRLKYEAKMTKAIKSAQKTSGEVGASPKRKPKKPSFFSKLISSVALFFSSFCELTPIRIEWNHYNGFIFTILGISYQGKKEVYEADLIGIHLSKNHFILYLFFLNFFTVKMVAVKPKTRLNKPVYGTKSTA